jgi:hypothetical protein
MNPYHGSSIWRMLKRALLSHLQTVRELSPDGMLWKSSLKLSGESVLEMDNSGLHACFIQNIISYAIDFLLLLHTMLKWRWKKA